MSKPHPILREAIDLKGSQEALAKSMGTSQSRVSRLYLRELQVSAEDAIAIERATGIPRWRLRPDLWPPQPAQRTSASA